MEEQLVGIIKYIIEANGCLVGIYTNNYCEGYIYPEMARKTDNNNPIIGMYDCFLYDCETPCRLEITQENMGNVYQFAWKETPDSEPFNRGIGMKIDEKTIVVAYL